MLTRRGFGACAICAAAGLVATSADAQQAGTLQVGQPQTMGGVTRTVLKRSDFDAKYVILLVRAEIDASTTVARHTHPGVESVHILEGGFEELAVQGQPNTAPKAGDSFQVAADTPHGGRTGPQPTKIIITYVVEKDKPLASPA